MARGKRVYYRRAIYHVSVRGNNKQDILGKDEDKQALIDSVKKFKIRFGFKLYGFVLMNNHAHFVIEPADNANISKIMQAVNLSYSFKFRKKYNYFGHVWQGRFKSNVIDKDNYIYNCLNYVHNNPVRAGLTKKIENYFWSSYHLYNNLHNPLQRYFFLDKFSYA